MQVGSTCSETPMPASRSSGMLVSTGAAASAASHVAVRVRFEGKPNRIVDLSLAATTAWLLVATGLLAGEMVYS